jgi:hypothetical protein
MTDLELGSNAGDDASLLSGRPTTGPAGKTTPKRIVLLTVASVAALFAVLGFFGSDSGHNSRLVRVNTVDPTSLASVPDMPSKDEAHDKLKEAHAAVSKHVSKALESEHAKKAKKHAKAFWGSMTSWWSVTTGMKDEVTEGEEKAVADDEKEDKEDKKDEDEKPVSKKDDDDKDDEASWYSGITSSLAKKNRKHMAKSRRDRRSRQSRKKHSENTKDEDVNGGGAIGMVEDWTPDWMEFWN